MRFLKHTCGNVFFKKKAIKVAFISFVCAFLWLRSVLLLLTAVNNTLFQQLSSLHTECWLENTVFIGCRGKLGGGGAKKTQNDTESGKTLKSYFFEGVKMKYKKQEIARNNQNLNCAKQNTAMNTDDSYWGEYFFKTTWWFASCLKK